MRGSKAGRAGVFGRVGWAGAAVVLALAACSDGGGGGSASLSALVQYAEGDWSCTLKTAGVPGLPIDATVEADSSGRGTFSFEIDGGRMVPRQQGEWQLHGTSLEMDVSDLSRYAVDGVDLDTDGIEILEDAPGSELQRVGVERDGDTVTFSWTDPFEGADVEMPCTKA